LFVPIELEAVADQADPIHGNIAENLVKEAACIASEVKRLTRRLGNLTGGLGYRSRRLVIHDAAPPPKPLLRNGDDQTGNQADSPTDADTLRTWLFWLPVSAAE
jgi:hypothetical protein